MKNKASINSFGDITEVKEATRLTGIIQRSVEKGAFCIEFSTLFRTKNMKEIPVSFNCLPLKGLNGEITGAVVTAKNLTQLRDLLRVLVRNEKA